MEKIIASLICAVLLASVAYAAVGVQDQGAREGTATDINFSTGFAVSNDGSTATITAGGSPTFTTVTATTIVPSNITASGISGALTASGTDLYWKGKKLSN